MRFLKRFFILLLSFLAILILLICIWISLPEEQIYLDRFHIGGAFVHLRLNLDKNNFSLLDEIVDFKFGEEFLVESFKERVFYKLAGRYFAPIKMAFFVNKSDEEGKFDYAILIKSKRLSRFLQIPAFIYTRTASFKKEYELSQKSDWLMWNKKENTSDLESFARYGDILLFSTNKQIIDNFIDSFYFPKKVVLDNFQFFLKNNPNKLFLLYLNDKERILDYYLEEAKEKTSYNFFPTISDLDEISIYLNKDGSSQKIYGRMDFAFKEIADFKKARKDVWFFSQVLKRVFEANFYQFIYKIEVTGNHVIADFNLTKGKKGNSND